MHRNFPKDSLEDIKRFNTFVIVLLKTTYKRHKHSLQLAEKCRSTVLRLFWPFSHTEARKTCLSSYRKASRRKRAERWPWWQITLKEALMLVTQRHWTHVEAREPARVPRNLGTFSSFPLTGREALSLWFLTEGFSALLSGICALCSSWEDSYSWSICKDKTWNICLHCPCPRFTSPNFRSHVFRDLSNLSRIHQAQTLYTFLLDSVMGPKKISIKF